LLLSVALFIGRDKALTEVDVRLIASEVVDRKRDIVVFCICVDLQVFGACVIESHLAQILLSFAHRKSGLVCAEKRAEPIGTATRPVHHSGFFRLQLV
jgi:hypothetical protein